VFCIGIRLELGWSHVQMDLWYKICMNGGTGHFSCVKKAQ